MIHNILRLSVYLSTVLIYWISSKVQLLLVSYESAPSRIFCADYTLLLSLRINVGSVVIIYTISAGSMMAFAVNSIVSGFRTLVLWVASRKSWWFMHFSRGKRVVGVSSWNIPGRLLQATVWKLPMFQQGWNSCGPELPWGSHASLYSSFLYYYKNDWNSSSYH